MTHSQSMGNVNRNNNKRGKRNYDSYNSESEKEKEEIHFLKDTIDLLKKEVGILRTNQLVINEQKASAINTSKDKIKQADYNALYEHNNNSAMNQVNPTNQRDMRGFKPVFQPKIDQV